ncbi:MAG: DoxX family protein [Ignavibacteria bacterium]|nr:DoxX family protein [Ignavibacteria bacterium]
MRKVFLYLMSMFYTAAGINHFLNPSFYEQIMPPYLPYHLPLIYISGLCEIVFGILLIPVSTRKIAAWLIILLLIVIFPANIQMAVDYKANDNPDLWIAIIRLPVQIVLIWWAWIFTKPSVEKSKLV